MSLSDDFYFLGGSDDHDADAEAERLLGTHLPRFSPPEKSLRRRAHPLKDLSAGRKLISSKTQQ